MIIREVRLENVKSYGSPGEVVTLARGVNAICGPNGAGKSTVLEAIGCALFQHLPYKHDEFVREGESSGTITVVIESSIDQREYHVVRRIGKGALHYVFDPDIGQQIARGEADVGRWLRQHLGVDDEVELRSLFLDSIGPPQGTLTAIFLEAPLDRRHKFDRLLRVAEYEEAYRRLALLDGALQAERKDLDVRIARLEGETRDLADLEARRAEKWNEQAELGRQLVRYLADDHALSQALVAFEEARQVREEARQQLDLAAAHERHAAERWNRAQADEAEAATAATTCTRTRAAHDRVVELENVIRQLEARQVERDLRRGARERVLQQLGQQRQLLEKVEAEVKRCEEAHQLVAELSPKIPEQEAAEARLQAARDAKRALDDLVQTIGTLRERLTRSTRQVEISQATLDAATRKRPLAEELPVRRARHQVLKARLAEATQAAGELKTLSQSQERVKERAAKLRQRLATLDDRIAAIPLPPAGGTVAALESRCREVSQQQAGANARLKHARETRQQVSGGLCPFLGEACRNLRPGVTLETHFDREVAEWSDQLGRLTDELARVERQLREARAAEEQRQRRADLIGQRTEIAAELVDCEAQLADLTRRQGEVAKLANRRATIEREEQEAQRLVSAAELAAQEVARLPALSEQLAHAQDERARAEAELASAEARASRREAIEAELRAAIAACNAIGRPREAVALNRPTAERLPDVLADRQRLLDQIATIQGKLDEIERELAPFVELDHALQAARQERDVLRPDYLAYVQARPLADQLAARTAAAAAARNEATRASVALAAAQRALDEAAQAYDEAAHDAARGRQRQLREAIAATQTRIEAAEDAERDLTRQIERLRTLERELAELRRDVERLDNERQLADTLRRAIREAGPEITKQILVGISRAASRINAEILNQAGVELEWTTDYEIVTHRQGEARGFAQLSGGEQMAAALAVRLAILRHLSKVRLAFLDEPTAHLDQARRANLGDQVQRLQGFDQLVVISHDDTFDGLFGHVVRIGRENGRSRVMDLG